MTDYNIITGNVFEELPKLASDSVDLCITSPPYWSQRHYGTAPVVIGGNKECLHKFSEYVRPSENKRKNDNTLTPNAFYEDEKQGLCAKCGAWKGSYGIEDTLERYLDNTIAWIKEVKRILKPTGSFVLNIGDCYLGGGKGGYASDTTIMGKTNEATPDSFFTGKAELKSKPYYKPKQFLSVSSFLYCRIVQETGLCCRSENIWGKNNVPSPIRTRMKYSHEKVYWFVKDADQYYFNPKPWLRKVEQSSIDRNFRAVDTLGHGQGAIQKDEKEKGIRGKSVAEDGMTMEHSWRIIPVGERQGGFEIEDKMEQLHVAPYPEELIRPWILSCAPPLGIVLDPFLGSGTTMKVARDNHISCTGIELNPEYARYAEARCNLKAIKALQEAMKDG